MAIGPMQVLVLGFGDVEFRGEALAELDRLRRSDIVRLVDMIAVRKLADGTVERAQRSDLSEEQAGELGAIAGALIGFGALGEEGAIEGAEAGAELMAESGGHLLDTDDVWFIEEAIPPGSTAVVAVLEHRWAIPLRETIRGLDGTLLADAWIHPSDLVAIGVAAAEEVAAS